MRCVSERSTCSTEPLSVLGHLQPGTSGLSCPHTVQQVQCPTVLGGECPPRKGPRRPDLGQSLGAEVRLGTWACSVRRRYPEENAGSGGHVGHHRRCRQKGGCVEWMSRLLQRNGLTIFGEIILCAPTCTPETQNKLLSALAARSGSEDPSSHPGAPGPATANLDFLRTGSES